MSFASSEIYPVVGYAVWGLDAKEYHKQENATKQIVEITRPNNILLWDDVNHPITYILTEILEDQPTQRVLGRYVAPRPASIVCISVSSLPLSIETFLLYTQLHKCGSSSTLQPQHILIQRQLLLSLAVECIDWKDLVHIYPRGVIKNVLMASLTYFDVFTHEPMYDTALGLLWCISDDGLRCMLSKTTAETTCSFEIEWRYFPVSGVRVRRAERQSSRDIDGYCSTGCRKSATRYYASALLSNITRPRPLWVQIARANPLC